MRFGHALFCGQILTNNMKDKRFAAIVPMRHSSERVPGKNYRLFNGRPLYHYIIETLQKVPHLGQVVIDTDSELISEDAAKHFPDVACLQRPQHLRDGEIPMNEVLLHTIGQVDADFYLQTHSTNPLLHADTIGRSIQEFADQWPVYDSLFGVTRLQTRLWDANTKPINHDPDILLRTQDLPPVYEENSCIYIFSEKILRERGNRIGRNPLMFEIERSESWDIDVEEDFLVSEYLHKLQNHET